MNSERGKAGGWEDDRVPQGEDRVGLERAPSLGAARGTRCDGTVRPFRVVGFVCVCGDM